MLNDQKITEYSKYALLKSGPFGAYLQMTLG